MGAWRNQPMPKPKYIRNSGKDWTTKDERLLKEFAKEDTPTPVIGLKLGRTPAAVYKKASELGVSLMPPNPHHRRK
jgi:hypothetical protein